MQMIKFCVFLCICTAFLPSKSTADFTLELTKTISLEELNADPMKEFFKWQNNSNESMQHVEGELAVLTTASKNGYPSMRMVYIVASDRKGFVFLGKENSYKIKNISENPHVELLFAWEDPERTVNVQGTVDSLSNQDADSFFKKLPKSTQLALSVAPPPNQSNISPKLVLDKYNKLSQHYQNQPVPRPADVVAYRVIPELFEFISYNTETDLNSRFVYTWQNNQWAIEQFLLP